MRYETTYVIVAGVAWIRRSRVETADGSVDDMVWAVTFEGDAPVVRRAPWSEGIGVRAGRIGDLEWDLDWRELDAPFDTPAGLLRRVAPTHVRTWPAIAVTGRVGEVHLESAPGHTAQLEGARHARTWGWAHATTADGNWVHVLTASAPPLPRVAQYGRRGSPPRLPIARSSIRETEVRVGPYAVVAPRETFIGLRYLDTDGSSIWCYHSERARLRGAGLDLEGAALEIAARKPLDGWSVEA